MREKRTFLKELNPLIYLSGKENSDTIFPVRAGVFVRFSWRRLKTFCKVMQITNLV